VDRPGCSASERQESRFRKKEWVLCFAGRWAVGSAASLRCEKASAAMMGYNYAPGVNNQEVEAALRSLSLREAEDVPVLAILPPSGGECEILFASRSMLALFGANDLAALAAYFRGASDPGVRRLNELWGSLPVDGGPRLERLRFYLGPTAQIFTFLCRKLARLSEDDARGPVFVVAALGLKAPLPRVMPGTGISNNGVARSHVFSVATNVASAVSVPNSNDQNADSSGSSAPNSFAPSSSAPIAAATSHRVAPGLASPSSGEPEVAPNSLTLEQVRRVLAPRFVGTRGVRFLWRTDPEGKITELTPPLAEVVGAAAADLLGRDFGDVAKFLELDPDGRLAQALAKRESWSGIDVLWPIAGAAAAVPVSLGGLPAYDRDRQFDGFRGFGILHVEKLVPAEPRHFGSGTLAENETIAPAPVALPTTLASPLANVVLLRPLLAAARSVVESTSDERQPQARDLYDSYILSSSEKNAFEAIAAALVRGQGASEQQKEEASQNDSPRALTPPIAAVSEGSSESPLGTAPAVSVLPETLVGAASDSGAEAAPEASAESVTPTAIAPEPRSVWLAQNGLGANATAIFDRLGQGLLVSRNDVPIYVNRYTLDLLGYVDEDEFYAAGGIARLFEQIPAAAGETVNVRTAAGTLVPVEAWLQSVEWDHLPATLLTLRRVEERDTRSKLEGALRKRENEVRELNAILDTATDGIAIIDAQGRIIALNRSAEALFGYDQREVVGQPLSILLTPESDTKAKDYFDRLRGNGVASLLNDGREVIGRARQGGAIPIFMTLGRVGGNHDNQTEQKYCALLRDMTHWKKVEQDLQDARRDAERASALKSDFLAKVSHEIRTPLNAILGFAEVIIEERFGPIGNDRYRDYLKDIHTSGSHVMSLVNDLLDLSKIEAGKMELAFDSVDANRVISECVSIMQPQANSERVIMRLALAPHLPKIMADERSLRQIILNLLSNAVKFNEPGGQVIVASVLTDAGQAVIRIRDTGIGMSEQDIETALEPFRQLATSRPTTGTGLGLPLTKALIEANRAFFTIKSKKNEGTLVEVAFPPARAVIAT
jgi:PAS domain S-box-containing protein